MASSSVGASGAVFGLFGAALVVTHRLGGDYRGIISLIVHQLRDRVRGRRTSPGRRTSVVWSPVRLLAAAYAYAPKERRTLVAFAAPVVLAAAARSSRLLLKYRSFGVFF